MKRSPNRLEMSMAPHSLLYRKGRVTHAMVRSSHIAKGYRQLKGVVGEGLESDDEDE
jgi:hypothetical protein